MHIGLRPDDLAACRAERAGFAAADVDRSRIHEDRNPDKRPIFERIPRGHLVEQVRRHCEPLASRLFPDTRSPEDAGLLIPESAQRP